MLEISSLFQSLQNAKGCKHCSSVHPGCKGSWLPEKERKKLYFEEKKFQPARSLSWAPGECRASPAFPLKGRAAQASQSLPPQRSQRISRSRGSAKNYFTEIDAEKFKAVFIYYEQFKAVFIYLFKAYFS